ncbi:perilipin-1 isoform X2 [Harpegnathos saltator]|uniref:Perilipin n=2 Tax=Harpegnathos saltator TaxID=610380 RepID=E2BGM3_HARSA|nr:perilipin-1 isoform X2 [Harpegnathos saltator]EFN85151.1 Perilipin [Harpegnathos saltator]
MCGTREPREFGEAASSAADLSTDNADVNAHNMVCTRRLLDLPLFAAVTSTLRNAYAVTKGSHEAVATILGYAEDGVCAGLQFASPVTERFADALKTPLKAVDDVVCIGLDYVEEKVPSVKLPPDQIYTNVRDCVRSIFTSALETFRLLFGGPKNQIEGSPAPSENAQEQTRRVPS